MKSTRFDLNKEDVKNWIKNTSIFLAPAALIFLLELEKGSSLEQSLIALKVWGLSTAIDLVRKYVSGK